MAEYFSLFTLPALITAAIAYLLGSVSFSIIFTKLFNNNQDIRGMGSGNAGLTNVLRSVGVKTAVFTFIFDAAKAGVAVCVGRELFRYVCVRYSLPPYLAEYGAYLAGFACVLGHIYPLYFGFRGGKGILSTGAMLAFIDWRVFVVAISIFVVVLAITKIVSISSILGTASIPISNFCFVYFMEYRAGFSAHGAVSFSYVLATTAFMLVLSAMLIWKHRANIVRLKNGTEKKFSVKH